MLLKINPHSSYKDGELYEIETFSNGAFSLKVKSNDQKCLYLCDSKGNTQEKCHKAESGILFPDGCYILQGEPAKNNFSNNEIVFRGVNPKGTLYTKDGCIIISGFDEYKVFSNGWYVLIFKETKQLFNSNHSLVTQNFIDCEVFGDNTYALRTNSVLYQNGSWRMFDEKNNFLGEAKDVVSFLGQGLYLVKDEEDTLSLYNVKKDLLAKCVASYEKLANDCFSLSFENGGVCMYSSTGSRISAIVDKNAKFLADGTFISTNGKLITGHYNSTGIVIKEFVYRYEIYKNYYLKVMNSTTELYNNSGRVESNCFVVSANGEFILVEKEKSYLLYNQYGKVFEVENA